MKRSQKVTMYWSLGGHFTVLLALLIFSLITSCKRRQNIDPHVFSLVGPPPKPEVEQSPTPPKQPAKKETPKPKPPKPKPEPPKKDLPKPKVTPVETKPKTASYDQFLKTHDLPEDQPQPQETVVETRVEDPMREIRQQLNSLMKDGPSEMRPTSESDMRAMHSYIGKIRGQIDILWQQPKNLPPGEWKAVVEFSVSSTGRISNVKFISKSGQTDFDQSLIRALNRFLTTNPPPDGRNHVFKIPFRMVVR
ncbi:MAG: TonB family protein [Opitutales bacterium]|nr:TonB family protein [Opitutales bacterium]